MVFKRSVAAGLKVVFLLRDPRAVLSSLLQAPTDHGFSDAARTKEAVCENAYSDVLSYRRQIYISYT